MGGNNLDEMFGPGFAEYPDAAYSGANVDMDGGDRKSVV